VIARQPVVTEPVDYGDREIQMTDIDFRIEDGYVIFSLDDVIQHRIVFIDYQGPTSPIAVNYRMTAGIYQESRFFFVIPWETSLYLQANRDRYTAMRWTYQIPPV